MEQQNSASGWKKYVIPASVVCAIGGLGYYGTRDFSTPETRRMGEIIQTQKKVTESLDDCINEHYAVNQQCIESKSDEYASLKKEYDTLAVSDGAKYTKEKEQERINFLIASFVASSLLVIGSHFNTVRKLYKARNEKNNA